MGAKFKGSSVTKVKVISELTLHPSQDITPKWKPVAFPSQTLQIFATTSLPFPVFLPDI